jgi:hypothetical protein
LPPAILTSGTRDLFLSDTVRAHRKLREAGVEAVLQVFEGQSHAQFLLPFLLETEDGELARFFETHLAASNTSEQHRVGLVGSLTLDFLQGDQLFGVAPDAIGIAAAKAQVELQVLPFASPEPANAFPERSGVQGNRRSRRLQT